MASLVKYVLKKTKAELNGIGISNYMAIAPQDATSPFCTLYHVGSPTDYSFTEIYEDINIQVSIFWGKMNNYNGVDIAAAILDIADDIYNLFDGYSATDGVSTINCTNIVRQQGPLFLEKEQYYQYILELQFKAQKSQ